MTGYDAAVGYDALTVTYDGAIAGVHATSTPTVANRATSDTGIGLVTSTPRVTNRTTSTVGVDA